MDAGGYKAGVRTVRAQLPDDKQAVLEAFLQRSGCTLGALLEALADILEELGPDFPTEQMVGYGPRWIARAQEITVERRRRPRQTGR